MSYLHGKFVWFEHLSNDIPAACKFYAGLLGWHTENMPMGDQPYTLIQNGSEGIGGLRAAPAGVPAGWISYLSVADVDASYAAALAAGAKGLMPPAAVGNFGRSATIADPTGAALSLWHSTQGDRADPTTTPIGDWLWNELSTPDDKAALAFYEKAFGFTHDSMDMGPQGTYYLLNATGKGRAGLMKAADVKAPAAWLPYVAVADCDASTAKAQALGARMVCVPPTDIPNVGRFSVVLDPLGAGIALMKPAPMP
jgi:predicted enzyme related to lactoylglutathione lyase